MHNSKNQSEEGEIHAILNVELGGEATGSELGFASLSLKPVSNLKGMQVFKHMKDLGFTSLSVQPVSNLKYV